MKINPAPAEMAPPAMPPLMAPPMGQPDPGMAQALEQERKARMAAEEERDAYGARMAQLHQELRALKDAQGGESTQLPLRDPL